LKRKGGETREDMRVWMLVKLSMPGWCRCNSEKHVGCWTRWDKTPFVRDNKVGMERKPFRARSGGKMR